MSNIAHWLSQGRKFVGLVSFADRYLQIYGPLQKIKTFFAMPKSQNENPQSPCFLFLTCSKITSCPHAPPPSRKQVKNFDSGSQTLAIALFCKKKTRKIISGKNIFTHPTRTSFAQCLSHVSNNILKT